MPAVAPAAAVAVAVVGDDWVVVVEALVALAHAPAPAVDFHSSEGDPGLSWEGGPDHSWQLQRVAVDLLLLDFLVAESHQEALVQAHLTRSLRLCQP